MTTTDASATDLRTRFGIEKVGYLDIAYREAGDPKNPTLVLLHGFPTSSHMFRGLLRELADEFFLVAPDYPGFGESSDPSSKDFDYTFDSLAAVVTQFLEQRGLSSYSLYIQDFGAPVGFRVAVKNPERVQGLIVQNGNAYEEGLGPGFDSTRDFWADRSEENERALDPVFSLEMVRWQYTHGTRNPAMISPDNWNLDFGKLSRPGSKENMLDLLYDYQNNVQAYPSWQAYLRHSGVPVLITWGKSDAFFPEPGAAAYKKDVRDLEYHILDTGHFALEEDLSFIADKARSFLRRISNKKK